MKAKFLEQEFSFKLQVQLLLLLLLLVPLPFRSQPLLLHLTIIHTPITHLLQQALHKLDHLYQNHPHQLKPLRGRSSPLLHLLVGHLPLGSLQCLLHCHTNRPLKGLEQAPNLIPHLRQFDQLLAPLRPLPLLRLASLLPCYLHLVPYLEQQTQREELVSEALVPPLLHQHRHFAQIRLKYYPHLPALKQLNQIGLDLIDLPPSLLNHHSQHQSIPLTDLPPILHLKQALLHGLVLPLQHLRQLQALLKVQIKRFHHRGNLVLHLLPP